MTASFGSRRAPSSLKASAAGFCPEERTKLATGGDPVRIRLRPAGSLSGRLFDAETGEPVAAFSLTADPQRRGTEVLGEPRRATFSGGSPRVIAR